MSAAGGAKRYDYLVVGAGFAGSVISERLASQLGARVLLIDRRHHIGGNAYDELDEAGILYHKYGPHIFHTNSDQVVDYLSQFTEWRPYEHRVLAEVRGQQVPIPINRTTLNKLFDLDLEDRRGRRRLSRLARRAGRRNPAPRKTSSSTPSAASSTNCSSAATRASNGASTRPSSTSQVTSRIPTRTNTDDRYFGDTFQAMPADGYTKMFEAMLASPLIEKRLGTDFRDLKESAHELADHIVYTGPIDEYFDFRFGQLPYRSLQFDHQTHDQEQFQPVAVVNYPDPNVPYTRISEYKHLTGQAHPRTTITYEYPSAEGDPYYPIPRPGESAAVQALRSACRRDRGRDLRRPAGDLSLLQHGPDRRPGAGDLPADERSPRAGAEAGDRRRVRLGAGS